MAGTSASATRPIRLMPPRMTAPVTTVSTMPVSQTGTPKVFSATPAMALACTMLPMPKPAKPAVSAKATPSQRQRGPRPF